MAHIIYGLKLAGAEKILVSLAVRPDRERYETLVVTLSETGPLEKVLRSGGVPVTFLRKRGRYDVSILYRLVRLLRKEKPDVVHTHLFGADVWGRVAASIVGVPLIVSSLQAVDIWLTPFQLFLERVTARFAHRLIAVSEEVKKFYVSRVGVPLDKISVVHNAIDCSRFPAKVDLREKRRELGLRQDALVIGTAGRLEEQKDLFTWLRAAGLIAKQNSDTEFVIAGAGSQLSMLKGYARELGISNRVHFLGLRPDIDELYAICDLVVFSSRFEGFSLSLLEAMASRKAVIATSIGENAEVIEHGQNGLLVKQGDEKAMALATIQLLGNDGERRRLGEAARRTVELRFNVDTMIEKVLNIYEDGLARGADTRISTN